MRRQTAIAALLEADFPSPRVQANVERIVEPGDQVRTVWEPKDEQSKSKSAYSQNAIDDHFLVFH